MKELNEVVQKAITELSESGKIKEMIDAKVERTIESIISDELGAYSDFGKALSTHIKEVVKVDFGGLGIGGYNDHILRLINTIMDKELHGKSEEKLKLAVNDMLKNPPEEIKLSEIIKEFKEHFQEEANEENLCEITCIVEDRNDNFFTRVYLDKEENKGKYQCDYSFGLSLNRKTGERTVYTMQIKGDDIKKGLFVGPYYGLERLMYQMHCCGTNVILDVEDDDMDLAFEANEEDY